MRALVPVAAAVSALAASAGPATAAARTPTACPDLFRRELPQIEVGWVTSMAAGDFDGDGRDDLVLAGPSGGGTLMSRPDGTFAFHRTDTTAAGWPPVVGDLNADGRADVVVSRYGGDQVTALLADGAGGFVERAGPLGAPAAPRAIADFDGDSHADVLVMSSDVNTTSYEVLRGDGTGALARTGMPLRAGRAWWGAVVGDFDADGRHDLVLDTTEDGSISFARGDGAGGFAPAVPAVPWVFHAFELAVADFDRDGRADVGIPAAGGTMAFKGDGTGRFAPFAASTGAPLVGGFLGTLTADFNGDGIPDLVHTSGDSNGEFYVMLGNGRGQFRSAAGSPEWGGRYPAGTAVTGDFNADGRPDLAGASQWQESVRVLLNTGGHGRQSIRFVQLWPRTVERGRRVVLTARLRCHPGLLRLYRRPAGARRWRAIATVHTNDRGNAVHTDRPRRTSEYRWGPVGRSASLRSTRIKVATVCARQRARRGCR